MMILTGSPTHLTAVAVDGPVLVRREAAGAGRPRH